MPGPKDIAKAARALFDGTFYLRENPNLDLAGRTPFEHFWDVGRYEGRNPNALFDGLHYRRQVRGRPLDEDPLADYVRRGASEGLSPHPLFDPEHYGTQVTDLAEYDTPLAHYRAVGWRQGLSPHLLFDASYYALVARPRSTVADPLEHYVTQGEHAQSPHYLFSDAVYLASCKQSSARGDIPAGEPALVHYLREGYRPGIATHPLFDPDYYVAELRKWARRRPSASPVRFEEPADPLMHYVKTGWRLGISPTPYFDVRFYQRQLQNEIEGDPLRDYLLPGGYSCRSPHPGMDIHHYARNTGLILDDVPSILHLIAAPEQERAAPHPVLDLPFYSTISRDLSAGASPVTHFLAHGITEGRSPNAFFSADYVRDNNSRVSFASESALAFYLASEMPRRVRVVFVSHDGSLTGAPGTALRLIEDFSRLSNVECFAILGNGGPRVADFKRVAHTLVLNTAFHNATEERLQRAVRQLLAATEGNEPVVAIVNSAESRAIGTQLARAGIPVITLVHEAADLYPAGAFDPILTASKRIIFGSEYVRARARMITSLPDGIDIVRGQGLQQDHIGRMPREEARRRLQEELGLPPDVFLVVGCGTVDYRKGADLFVTTALKYIESYSTAERLAVFVWLGEGRDSGLRSFVNNQICSHGCEQSIRFIGGRSDVEPYFVAADVFLMTSRADPFPCVCQEAMAAGVPIIAFTEGGGTVEMIGDEAGICVPLADTKAMADKIALLARDGELRDRYGRRARELVRQKWNPVDYADFVAELASEVSRIPRERFGMRPADHYPDARRIFLLYDDWTESARCQAGDRLASQLSLLGYDVEIVLTKGRFSTPGRDKREHVPSSSYRYLQPSNIPSGASASRIGLEEIRSCLLRLCREAGPCVFISMGDLVVAEIGGDLPSWSAMIMSIEGAAIDDLDHVYRFAPYLDHIAADANATKQKLLLLNASLGEKSSMVGLSVVQLGGEMPPVNRTGCYVRANLVDSEQRSLLQAMLAARRDGTLDLSLSVDTDGVVELEGSGFTLGKLLESARATSLATARYAVFLDNSVEREAIVEAMAAGCIPIVVRPREAVLELNADQLIVVAVWGEHASLLPKHLARLSASAHEREALLDASRIWLARNAISAEQQAERYDEVLHSLFQGLSRGV